VIASNFEKNAQLSEQSVKMIKKAYW